jgi:uncharacterized Zn finger protein (UPF0148 family)
MTTATGSVYCPRCGESVPFQAEMRTAHKEPDHHLWVQLYDAKPRHKCQKGA